MICDLHSIWYELNHSFSHLRILSSLLYADRYIKTYEWLTMPNIFQVNKGLENYKPGIKLNNKLFESKSEFDFFLLRIEFYFFWNTKNICIWFDLMFEQFKNYLIVLALEEEKNCIFYLLVYPSACYLGNLRGIILLAN